MWFKNLRLYRLQKPFELTPEAFAGKLAAHPARECGQLEPFTLGWCPPRGGDEAPLIHVGDGRIMFALRRNERVLPGIVVRQLLEERMAQLEAERGRKVGRKERLELRDAVVQELLPRAFVRSSETYAYLDPDAGWLLVNAGSSKKADELTGHLLETMPLLPLALPQLNQSVATVATSWLLAPEQMARGFSLEDECELVGVGEFAGVIRCRKQDLASSEVRAHAEAGKQAKKVAINYADRLSFVLHDDLTLRRLRFGEIVAEEAGRDPAEDEATAFDVDFVLMGAEFAEFIPQLLEALGGEDCSKIERA